MHGSDSHDTNGLSELRESRDKVLSATLDNTPLALVFFKVEQDNIAILYWNEAARRIFGWSKEEVLGRNFFEFLPAADAVTGVREIFETLVRDRDPHNITHLCNTKAGNTKMIQWFNSSFISENGRTIYVVSLGQDVTERLWAERARRQWGTELEARVAERTAELVRANELLQLEIEQRKKVEEALREAKAAAEEANEAKSRFLAGMSHELRTPLNGIIGFSDVLRSGSEEDIHRDGKKYLGHIHQSGKHLLALINDLLDMAKIEAGKLQINWEVLRVDELVDSVLQMLSGRVIEKEIHTDVSIDASVSVRADRRLLRQVLLNLLSNAVKYSPPGETISIRVSDGDSDGGAAMVRITVCDRGPGIPEEHKERIFSEFYQIDQPRDIGLGGTGLGLALCRHLVTEQGGRIGVENLEGGGSRFWFTIPAASMSDSSADTPEKQSEHREGETQEEKQGEKKRKILVAEDNPVNRELITVFMSTIGYDFTIAENGREAVALAGKYRPDLILMDIMMPVMDGFEATRQLRGAPETAEIPIIALTAAVDEKARATALEAGCDLHLPKPINLKILKEAIESLLSTESTG